MAVAVESEQGFLVGSVRIVGERRKTRNAQRPTLNVEVTNRGAIAGGLPQTAALKQ